jgi:microcystin-dependent protein
MAQADQSIQNATFPTVRADINGNLAALFSDSSGNGAPSVTVAFQDWIDTSGADAVWKKRNAANNAWLTVATFLGSGLSLGGFPPGTVMLFVQTAAPTGWTKSTTHDNKALRVVSGSVTTGGTQNFTAVLNGTVGATTLTTAQIPSHTHTLPGGTNVNVTSFTPPRISSTNLADITTNATGGGGSHTHSMDVAYVDVIIATKD